MLREDWVDILDVFFNIGFTVEKSNRSLKKLVAYCSAEELGERISRVRDY
jgi:hypothetical protein